MVGGAYDSRMGPVWPQSNTQMGRACVASIKHTMGGGCVASIKHTMGGACVASNAQQEGHVWGPYIDPPLLTVWSKKQPTTEGQKDQ